MRQVVAAAKASTMSRAKAREPCRQASAAIRSTGSTQPGSGTPLAGVRAGTSCGTNLDLGAVEKGDLKLGGLFTKAVSALCRGLAERAYPVRRQSRLCSGRRWCLRGSGRDKDSPRRLQFHLEYFCFILR